LLKNENEEAAFFSKKILFPPKSIKYDGAKNVAME